MTDHPIRTISHVLPVSDAVLLDHGLLSEDDPRYAVAVEQQRQRDERIAAWRRSWPGRRSRAIGTVRAMSHRVRHALARGLDPGCLDDDSCA